MNRREFLKRLRDAAVAVALLGPLAIRPPSRAAVEDRDDPYACTVYIGNPGIGVEGGSLRFRGSVTLMEGVAVGDQVALSGGAGPTVTFSFQESAGAVAQTDVLREVMIGRTPTVTASNLQRAIENAPVKSWDAMAWVEA